MILTEEEKWKAVVQCDSKYDGTFEKIGIRVAMTNDYKCQQENRYIAFYFQYTL